MFAVVALLLVSGASMDHQESGGQATEAASAYVDEQSVTVCGDCVQGSTDTVVQQPETIRTTPRVVVRVAPRNALILNRPIRVSLSIRIEHGGDFLWCPEYEIQWGDGTKTGPNGGDCPPYEEASTADREVQVLPDKGRSIQHNYVTNGEFLIVARFMKSGRVIRQHEGVRVYIKGGGE